MPAPREGKRRRAGDARFEAVLEGAPDSIVGVSPEGRIVFVNREAERSFGYAREELIGAPVEILVPERFRERHAFHRAGYAARPTRRPMGAGLDLVGRRRDGSEFPIEISLSPVDGDPALRVTAVIRDVTERREAERRLRESERYLRLAQQVASVGSWSSDPTTRAVWWSDQLYAICGLEPGDPRAAGDNWFVMVHEDDRGRFREAMRASVERRAPLAIELRVVRPDGSLRIVDCRAEVVRDAAEGVARLIGTVQDVTDRRSAEAALRESERRLSTLISNLPGVVYRCRNDGRWTIELVSEGALTLFGLRPEDLVGQRSRLFTSLIHPDDYPRVKATIAAALGGSRPFQATYRLRHPSGEIRWVWEQGRAVVGEDGRLVAVEGFLADVTDRQRALEALERARDEALAASRLKSAFLSTISHEIRTPLNVILGYTSLIAEGGWSEEDEERCTMLDGIERAGKRLVSTVHQVLDYSRIETGDFPLEVTAVDLGTALAGVVAEYQQLAHRKGLEFSWRNEVPGVTVRFDSGCLLGAVRGLLDNAVKFTIRGSVCVALRRGVDGSLLFEVADTGVGVGAEYLPRLFEPFSQEIDGYTRPFEGAGIGLALARRYLELNGAHLRVQTRKGKGSVFAIRFPRVLEEPSSGFETPPGAWAGSGNDAHRPAILVVDDDEDTRRFLQEALGPRFALLPAATGPMARRQLARHRGDVEAIFMDLSLEGSEDALSFARWLRAQADWRDVPVIATAAHGSPRDRDRALEAGCTTFLEKPLTSGDLAERIWSVARSPRIVTRH